MENKLGPIDSRDEIEKTEVQILISATSDEMKQVAGKSRSGQASLKNTAKKGKSLSSSCSIHPFSIDRSPTSVVACREFSRLQPD